MMSIFVSSLADLTAGIAFQPVINRFAGVHKPDLDDNAVVNVAVGIASIFALCLIFSASTSIFSVLSSAISHALLILPIMPSVDMIITIKSFRVKKA